MSHLPTLILFQNHLPKSLQTESIGSPENPLYLHVLQHPRFYLPKHKKHGLMVKFCVLLWLAPEKHLLCVISIHTCQRQDCGNIGFCDFCFKLFWNLKKYIHKPPKSFKLNDCLLFHHCMQKPIITKIIQSCAFVTWSRTKNTPKQLSVCNTIKALGFIWFLF